MAQSLSVLIFGVSVLERGNRPGAVNGHNEAIVALNVNNNTIVRFFDSQACHKGSRKKSSPEQHFR